MLIVAFLPAGIFGFLFNKFIKAHLFSSWTVSKNLLTWTFKLRPGLHFHTGAPVTAANRVPPGYCTGPSNVQGNIRIVKVFGFGIRKGKPSMIVPFAGVALRGVTAL